jgi:aminopeptidase N
MRQLELLLGAGELQHGLRAYLQQFSFGNATWLDLVRLLDARTERNLAAWSSAWVEQAGRPTIRTSVQIDADVGRVRELAFINGGAPQRVQVLAGTAARYQTFDLELTGDKTIVDQARGLPRPFVLPTGGGLGYGLFVLDVASQRYLLEHASEFRDPLTRGAAWITLWDQVLERWVPTTAFLEAALRALPEETTEQNVQLLTGYVADLFWRYVSDSDRASFAPRVEATLSAGIRRSSSSSMKATYFNAFRTTVTSADGLAFLERVWRRAEKIPGLPLAEPDEANMALDLAVRSVPNASAILDEQRQRFTNPDRKARFEFVMPALSADAPTRDRFFESLRNVNNRRREPWVLEGLRYLNHPLRANDARKHVRPALDLLPEIRRTGDIFFPARWTDAVLSGHRDTETAAIVRAFLEEQRDLPDRLKRIVLQSADPLFRAGGL